MFNSKKNNDVKSRIFINGLEVESKFHAPDDFWIKFPHLKDLKLTDGEWHHITITRWRSTDNV